MGGYKPLDRGIRVTPKKGHAAITDSIGEKGGSSS